MPRTIMGLETRACINGLDKTDFENVKKIPTIESETNEIKNDSIPSLDERVTALEQGSSGTQKEWTKINIDDILEYVDHDEEKYFFNTDLILNLNFLSGSIDYDNLTRPYYFNAYQYMFFKNEYILDYLSDMPIEIVKERIIISILNYIIIDNPISLPKQDSGLKAIGVINHRTDVTFNSQTNYYEQSITGYIIINDTNLTFKEVTGKIVYEEFSIYAYVEPN